MKRIFLATVFTLSVICHIFAIDIDEARELLLAEEGGNILYLSKINLGISGGDNWIANRSDDRTFIYTISDDKEVKYIDRFVVFELSKVRYRDKSGNYTDLKYDFLQGISGTRLGEKAAKFGDYNGDGIDEILMIWPYDESKCYIWGYDNDKINKVYYFSCIFNIINPNEPSPIIFANYQGKDGILVHIRNDSLRQYVWLFFEWDEESREFLSQMEISADEIDFSQFTIFKADENEKEEQEEPSQPVLETHNTDEFVETRVEQKAAFTTGLGFYIGIGGIFVIAAVVFVLIRKKKRV